MTPHPTMESRMLGRTGLPVQVLGLGTVELGLEYGIQAPGEFGRPSAEDAIDLLRHAADGGVNFFDTAPGYGAAEGLLGEALGARPECVLATKVTVPLGSDGRCAVGDELRYAVEASIFESLRALQRDTLDVVQIHNATLEVMAAGELAAALEGHCAAGHIRFLGASVYTEAEALAAIETGCFDVLQIAYNMLDQRMARRVFPAARDASVGLAVRSAFLKGALTAKSRWLPDDLGPLAAAADRLRAALGLTWEELPHAALRFCLSSPEVATVVVGVRTLSEFDEALTAATQGPLPDEMLAVAAAHAITDDDLLNPAKWRSV